MIALGNALLGLPFELYNDWMGLEGAAAVEPLTFQQVLGWLFWPFAFLIGVPAAECATVGTLLGEKIVLTEFIAYLHLYESLSEGGPVRIDLGDDHRRYTSDASGTRLRWARSGHGRGGRRSPSSDI